MTVEGVDYAFPPRPDIGELARLGKKFACRYGGPGTLDKQLDPVEAAQLSAAGIAIVANAEGSSNGLTGGWSVGVSWAQKAEARFRECGMPSDRPIYFSVDFDVVAEAWPNVREALRGAASVLGGTHRVGVYGGIRAIQWARRDGVASWFWQTYAWSGGRWEPGNHIEQYHNGVTLAGADCDLNRALQNDYGQWTTTGDDMFTEWHEATLNGISERSGETLNELRALRAAEETRGAAMLAAITALANAGGVDAAPIVAAIKAEADKTRALVEERHAEEIGELRRQAAAEMAGMQAELDRLRSAGMEAEIDRLKGEEQPAANATMNVVLPPPAAQM